MAVAWCWRGGAVKENSPALQTKDGAVAADRVTSLEHLSISELSGE